MVSQRIDLSGKHPTILSWLQERRPQAADLAIASMERSGAGLSNETFFLDVRWEEGGQSKSEKMVFRFPPTGYPVFPSYDLSKQFRVMQLLAKTNVPVPEVRWFEEDEQVLGMPFYVMRFTEGIIPPEYPPYHSFGIVYDASPQQRAKMWWSGVEVMAKVHTLDWQALGFSFLGVPEEGTDPIDRELDYWENYLNWAKEEPQPILEAALQWLRENKYAPKHVSLCWGDSRLPNIIFGPDNDVLAVLDWEMANLSDPESDLGWFLFLDWQHCEGYGIPRLEGFPSAEETVKRYEELTGRKVEHLHYNEVLAALRFGIIMLKLYKNFKRMGITLPAEDAELNNVCTQRLASLLDLAPPGERQKRETTNLEDVTVTAQFHLTGPGGGDWYVLCDKGKASRHEGLAENPNVTLSASAADWGAIQRGEMDRIQAWMGGKLTIDGDMALLLQMEDAIARLDSQENP
jgi:aminoglycoside phosphotransferase (APT) family kinase protein